MKTSDTKLFLLPMMLFLAFSSLSEANPSVCYAPSAQQAAQYSFIQLAQKAIFKKNDDSSYTLTLKRIAPYVTYYSDRPNRTSQSMPLTKFISLWNTKGAKGFQGNPPNADIHGIKFSLFSNHQQYNFLLELSNPQYDETFKTLTYTAKPLQNSTVPTTQSDIVYDVTLFIDGVSMADESL